MLVLGAQNACASQALHPRLERHYAGGTTSWKHHAPTAACIAGDITHEQLREMIHVIHSAMH